MLFQTIRKNSILLSMLLLYGHLNASIFENPTWHAFVKMVGVAALNTIISQERTTVEEKIKELRNEWYMNPIGKNERTLKRSEIVRLNYLKNGLSVLSCCGEVAFITFAAITIKHVFSNGHNNMTRQMNASHYQGAPALLPNTHLGQHIQPNYTRIVKLPARL